MELLVVIAIIAILAALLLPVLAHAKATAWQAVCLNNKKQLSLTWIMYSEDHNGFLVHNNHGNDAGQSMPVNWVRGFMSWETSQSNTNTAHLVAERHALFAPYLKNWRTYKCPADRYLSPVQRAAGWTERVRSVSMNSFMGGVYDELYAGVVRIGNTLPWYVKQEQLRKLSPSKAFVFIDSHPDDYLGVEFRLEVLPEFWHSFPASYHNGGAGLSFADGHAETHRWQVPETRQPVTFVYLPAIRVNLPKDSRDWRWLWERATEPKD